MNPLKQDLWVCVYSIVFLWDNKAEMLDWWDGFYWDLYNE